MDIFQSLLEAAQKLRDHLQRVLLLGLFILLKVIRLPRGLRGLRGPGSCGGRRCNLPPRSRHGQWPNTPMLSVRNKTCEAEITGPDAKLLLLGYTS